MNPVAADPFAPRMEDRMRLNDFGRSFRSGFVWGMGAWVTLGAAVRADDSVRLVDYFGFQPTEVYKLDNRITGVITRDFDDDKAEDIAIVNNAGRESTSCCRAKRRRTTSGGIIRRSMTLPATSECDW